MSTEARLKRIGAKVRGWRNYHQYCDMGKHSLWFLNKWLWRKLRRDKARTKEKELRKKLSAKKAGKTCNLKAIQMQSHA